MEPIRNGEIPHKIILPLRNGLLTGLYRLTVEYRLDISRYIKGYLRNGDQLKERNIHPTPVLTLNCFYLHLYHNS